MLALSLYPCLSFLFHFFCFLFFLTFFLLFRPLNHYFYYLRHFVLRARKGNWTPCQNQKKNYQTPDTRFGCFSGLVASYMSIILRRKTNSVRQWVYMSLFLCVICIHVCSFMCVRVYACIWKIHRHIKRVIEEKWYIKKEKGWKKMQDEGSIKKKERNKEGRHIVLEILHV